MDLGENMSAFPESARVVIVGLGGIVGASVAHHLIERGWKDIVGIDKSAIPTDIGSTSHASVCVRRPWDLRSPSSLSYYSVRKGPGASGCPKRLGHAFAGLEC